jgi:succinoglycan biosynthesis protein ExoM
VLKLDVCVCTYRRESLEATLTSISEQKIPPDVSMRVVVADNDDLPTKGKAVAALGSSLGLDLVYVHAPAQNISVARNACLNAANGDAIAFIDDDETAAPDWLQSLVPALSNCDVVFGTSQAVYPAEAPTWMREGDFHSNAIRGNDPAWNGYTANVVMRREFVERFNLRFDLRFGKTGGEDTIFFLQAFQCGARFGFVPEAHVFEPVPASRARLRWLLRRNYRAGQVHHTVLRRLKVAGKGTLLAAAKASALVASTAPLALAGRRSVAVRNLLRAALQIGVVTSALGYATIADYGKTEG